MASNPHHSQKWSLKFKKNMKCEVKTIYNKKYVILRQKKNYGNTNIYISPFKNIMLKESL
jgi:hypothetical protein